MLRHESFMLVVYTIQTGTRCVRVAVPSGWKWTHSCDVTQMLGWYGS